MLGLTVNVIVCVGTVNEVSVFPSWSTTLTVAPLKHCEPPMFKLHVTDADVSDALETEQTAVTDSCITFTLAVMVTGEQSSDDIDTVVVYVLLL